MLRFEINKDFSYMYIIIDGSWPIPFKRYDITVIDVVDSIMNDKGYDDDSKDCVLSYIEED